MIIALSPTELGAAIADYLWNQGLSPVPMDGNSDCVPYTLRNSDGEIVHIVSVEVVLKDMPTHG